MSSETENVRMIKFKIYIMKQSGFSQFLINF